MKPRIRTTPDLSATSPAHQEAALNGEDYLWRWSRNVIDEYKSLSDEEIKDKVKETSFPYCVCFENWAHDFNISSGIRNANAFGVRCVYYVGDKRLDRRGAAGTYKYTELKFIPTIDEFFEICKDYEVVGVDNVPGAISINEAKYAPNTMFVFGTEGTGLTPAMISYCKQIIYIKQFGSVRSINAATASGIVMNDYVSKLNS
jgi:tRNA G18 (ribose-2'-O)-methylase SpoU